MILSFIAISPIAISFLSFVAIVILYHKISKQLQIVRIELQNSSDNTISQVEGLLGIYAEIRAQRTLPKTRGWAASPDLLHVLAEYVQRRRPMIVLECSSGVSTVLLAASLRNLGRGHVYSLEHDPEYAAKSRALLELHELEKWATVIDAPLIEVAASTWRGRWYDITGLPVHIRADLLVVDGPPTGTSELARFPALPVLLPFLSEAAVVVMDDATRESEQQTIVKWKELFPHISELPAAKCEKGCVVFAVLKAATD